MKTRVRVVLFLLVLMATMSLANCSSYSCGGFGGLSCGSGGGGNGGGPIGGGGGGTAAAFVFVQNGTASPGEVVGYTLSTTDAAIAATSGFVPPETPGFDQGFGMVVAQSQYLYTAYGSSNQVYGWQISSSGLLTAITNSPFSASFESTASLTFDTNRLTTNPAGTLLFVADAAQDEIFVFQIGSGGVLAPVTGSPFTVPFSPGNMTTDGLGLYLYITATFSDHTGSEVGAYSIGGGSNLGVLTSVVGSPFAFPMWQVEGEPTGAYLIGTSGNSAADGFSGVDDDNLYVFAITQSGASAGAITAALNSPVPTVFSPLGIAVQTNAGGNLVYSFSLNDAASAFNAIEGYELTSGVLTAVTESPFTGSATGDEGAFDQSGALLFNFGGLTNGSTVAYDVTAFNIVSNAPTNPASTLTYGGFWAATDVP